MLIKLKNILKYLIIGTFFLSYSATASESTEIKFVKSLTLNAKKNEVWTALTNESELGIWWNKGVKLEPRIGGEFYEPWGDNQLATGKVIEVEPNKVIKFTWQEKNWKPSEKTNCTFSLKEINGVTTLEVKHSGWETFKDSDEQIRLMNGFKKGWDFILAKLIKYLEEKEKL